MNTYALNCLFAATLCITSGQRAFAQGFVNLDFESPNTPLTPSDPFDPLLPFSDAFPGWTGYLESVQTTHALYNWLYLGGASIALLGVDRFRGPLIEGNYSAVLQPGRDPFSGVGTVTASITQTGLVPSDSLSLRFKVYSADTPFDVTLGAQSLALYPLSMTADYVLYGADISTFAGLLAELRFTALSDNYPRPKTSELREAR